MSKPTWIVLLIILATILQNSTTSTAAKNRNPKNIYIPIPWITVPTTAAPTTQLSADTINFMNVFTQIQNVRRGQHGASNLNQNNVLAAAAQTCANMYLAQNPTFNPVPTFPSTGLTACGQAGEIRYYGIRDVTSGGAVAVKVMDLWYAERPASLPVVLPDVGTEHFTQMVWKASFEYGCGIAFNGLPVGNPLAGYFVSCIYNLPGNNGDYAANVQFTPVPGIPQG